MPIIEGPEDELEKILETPEVPKEEPDRGVFDGAHSGSYENSIKLYLKDNNTDKIKDLIQEIFKNFDDVISGRVKLGQFDQEIGFYIYEKKQFGKRIGDIFIRETKAALKNKEEEMKRNKAMAEKFYPMNNLGKHQIEWAQKTAGETGRYDRRWWRCRSPP